MNSRNPSHLPFLLSDAVHGSATLLFLHFLRWRMTAARDSCHTFVFKERSEGALQNVFPASASHFFATPLTSCFGGAGGQVFATTARGWTRLLEPSLGGLPQPSPDSVPAAPCERRSASTTGGSSVVRKRFISGGPAALFKLSRPELKAGSRKSLCQPGNIRG